MKDKYTEYLDRMAVADNVRRGRDDEQSRAQYEIERKAAGAIYSLMTTELPQFIKSDRDVENEIKKWARENNVPLVMCSDDTHTYMANLIHEHDRKMEAILQQPRTIESWQSYVLNWKPWGGREEGELRTLVNAARMGEIGFNTMNEWQPQKEDFENLREDNDGILKMSRQRYESIVEQFVVSAKKLYPERKTTKEEQKERAR